MAGKGELPFTRVIWGFGLRQVIEVVRAVLGGKPRSVAEDAERVVSLMDPSPRLEGLDLIPPREPFVLVGNHFEAPNLWVGWVTAAITDAVAKAREPGSHQLHWLVISEWRLFEAMGHWVPNPVTSFIFPRACQVWGMIPTPARPTDVAGRARALRQILTYLKRRSDSGRTAFEPIGVFPEGEATSSLQEAKPGTGAFLQRINKLGVPLLPVGVYKEGAVLIVRFGKPFFVGEPPRGGEEETDEWARRQVMVAIGRLLPERLWGAYAVAIAKGD